MCRCAERRAAIGRVVSSLADGEFEKARMAEAARFVTRTMVEDARALVSGSRLAAARMSLRR
ncbi:conserved hypothetical protein [Methylocella tundrae]|uniref:Uncharacterized protein n=1 Tax=Methylocella tundrae TaxID=227605 RepID=A0A8B6MC47_METTU|nr:hypothetical protein [Methylocella tundrae]VTZ27534.1 conserved hypothetical protein [Methylocella tundrae]VTZ52502.1 conserved hypothetical protein [Methylocella tundrae]